MREFVLVMREQQIVAAAMQIETLAEIAPAHRRALDMPARTAATPGRVPAGQVIGGGLPQDEIAGIALVGGDLHTGTGQQILRRAARQFAVIGIGAHREQHMTIGGIGVAAGDEFFDDGDHLRDILGRPRFDIRRQRAERRHVGVEIGERFGGDLQDRHTAFLGAGVDLVIDVGDVAHIGHARIEHAQQPGQHVEHHHGAGVADMGAVIDRRPADIHAHMAGIERGETLALPRQAVVQAQTGHLVSIGGNAGRSGYQLTWNTGQGLTAAIMTDHLSR